MSTPPDELTPTGPAVRTGPAHRRPWSRPDLSPVVAIGAWLVGALVFFRGLWRTGFDSLMGNDGDFRLEAYLCEHWFRVFHGQEAWKDMPFFHPVKGLLGWSDTFFAFSVVYAPLREMGCGPTLAYQLTAVALSGVGFVGFFYLVRTVFPSSAVVAAVGAGIFTFSNAMFIHAGSDQLCGIYILPVILLLVVAAYRRVGQGRAMVPATAAGLLFGLLFFSTFYVAAFTTLAVLVFGFWLAVLQGRNLATSARSLVARTPLTPIAGAAVGCLVGLAPALDVYLPARSQTPGVPYSTILAYSVSWKDLFHPGPENLVWGPLVRNHPGLQGSTGFEFSYVVTPIVLLLALAGGAFLAGRLISGRVASTRRAQAGVALALTSVVLTLLPVRFFGTPPWALVWHVPGFNAIRAIDRVEILTLGTALLVIVAAAHELYALGLRSIDGRVWRAVGALVLLLALAEQVNRLDVGQTHRKAQDQLLASFHRAPPSCRYFYVVDSAGDLPFYESQIDAMFAAQRAGIPTINGYTGYTPKGWDLSDIGSPQYLANVKSWEHRAHLGEGACRLDLADFAWSPA